MERAGDHRRSKNSGLLRFLAKSTSFSIPRRHFYNPPRERSYFNKAFSGPIVSIIPAEARHREEKRSTVDGEEPLSPKVSCIGRIKGKKRSSEPGRQSPPSVQQQQQQQQKKKKKKKQQQAFFSFRAGKATEERADEKGRRSGAAVGDGSSAPRIGEMRRFASGRETIADFDWRKCESTAYNHEVIIAYSAPLMVGGSGGDRAVAVAPEPEPEPEPRKEVNIWKRRTMAPPRPLQV